MRRAATIATLLVVGIIFTGCGGSTDSATSDSANYQLTAAVISQTAKPTSRPAAVRALLEFWRAVQYQNYPLAYTELSSTLSKRIPYGEFVTKLAEARSLFLVIPRVEEVSGTDAAVTVNLLLRQGEVPSASDVLIGFDMSRVDGGWGIAGDPFNVFRRPLALDSAHPRQSQP